MKQVVPLDNHVAAHRYKRKVKKDIVYISY